jgi:hypothetical protein
MGPFWLVNVSFSTQIFLILDEIFLCMQCFSWKLFFPQELHRLEDVYALTMNLSKVLNFFGSYLKLLFSKNIFDLVEVYLGSHFL